MSFAESAAQRQPRVLTAADSQSHIQYFISSICTAEDYVLVVTNIGGVYKADLRIGSVDKVAQVERAWKILRHGNRALLSSLNGNIHLLDAQSGSVLRTITAHEGGVRCLDFLNDQTFVSGSRDKSLRTWSLKDDLIEHTMTFVGHGTEVRCVAAHGTVIASASVDGEARVWNAETGECLHILRGHCTVVSYIKYDGLRIVTSGTDGDIRVWNPTTGSCDAVLEGHGMYQIPTSPIRLLAGTLFSVGRDGAVRSWNLDKRPPADTLLSAASDSLTVDLDIKGDSLIQATTSGALNILNIDSRDSFSFWENEAHKRLIFRVGFAGNSPVAAYRRNGYVHVAVF